ncbi:MAG: (d)CMP kinase [Acidimicrobiia bacterium]
MVIAIDGPGGVGKSTVSQGVSAELGLAYLDTGSTYRAATLVVLRSGVDVSNEEAILQELSLRTIDYSSNGIMLDGESIVADVRSAEVTGTVSAVSAHPKVREAIVELQRAWVADHNGDAVVEGRDIGTVVFPDAPVKVFLTASPEVRAARRAGDDEASAQSVAEIAAALRARDEADANRETSPMRAAGDAVVIDTSEMTIDEVIGRIVAIAGRSDAAI